jgi:uncharacterized protein with HEPN domain
MPPRTGKYLQDILDAARLIRRFTSGQTFAEYETDILIRSGVERQLTILCEAMTQLSDHDPDSAARISESEAIVGMRIVLVHRYGELDNRRVWDTIQSKLPILIREVEALLEET